MRSFSRSHPSLASVSRETALALLALLLVACPRTATPPARGTSATAPSAALPPTAAPLPSADVPEQPTPDAAAGQQIDWLARAWPEAPISETRAREWLVQLEAQPAELRRSALFAILRRAPSSVLSQAWAQLLPAERTLGLRALAGRPRSQPPTDVLALISPEQARADAIEFATLLSRFRLPSPEHTQRHYNPAAANENERLAAARWLTAPNIPLPPVELLQALPASSIAPLARTFAARSDTPAAYWTTLVDLTVQRTRAAPRLWANAWRAVRDAIPESAHEVRAHLQTVLRTNAFVPGLTGLAGANLRCENAAVIDRATGWPEVTRLCADAAERWVSLAAQADVLGSRSDRPAERVAALQQLLASTPTHTQVTIAVARAATQLPPSQALPLLRRLSTERDPGVLATLLEGLEAHPAAARALSEAVRTALLQAPFTLPEGPSLEARVNALKLAHTLGTPELLRAQATQSSLRAYRLALEPDTVLEEPSVPLAPSAPSRVRVRFETELGPFELELRPDRAPQAVALLTEAVRLHRYDGLTMHRAVPGFVVQGGDPRGDGFGGTERVLRSELSLEPFTRGAVGVPLAGLDTGGMQLFVVLADAPHLDGRYPWIGRVSLGLEVLEALLPGDRIVRAELLEAPL